MVKQANMQALFDQYVTKMPTIKVGDKLYNAATGMDSGVTGATAPNWNNGIGPSVFSVGNQLIEPNLFAWYTSQGFIGYQACAILSQQWLVNKGCEMRGKDAAAKWFKVSCNDGQEVGQEVFKHIDKMNRKMKLKENLAQAVKFNAVFGIRHVLFVVDSDDPLYYEKPFNPDAIKKGQYKGMSQIDPYWVAQNLSMESVADPASIHFYEPEHWTIGSQKYHRSHFVILRGPEVSDFLKPSYQYGGLSLVQQAYERVYAAERTANEGPQLAMTKRLLIYKLADLKKALAKPDALAEANRWLTEFRDNYGVQYANKDENIEQIETALTDLDVTIMTQYQIVAAIFRVPATKLLGTSPKGFQSTGEHEISTYHEELENVQENEMDPIVERHLECLMKSEIEPKFGVSFECDVTWNPLNVESRKEKAEIAEIESRTDQNHINNGTIDAIDARERISADENSGYNGIEVPDRDDLEYEEEEVEATGQDVIEKEGDKWFVYSETGERLSRGYGSKGEAEERLRQIEWFAGKDECLDEMCDEGEDAEYHGKKVELNKPRRSDGPKKFEVFVKNDKGNVVKVSFGDPNMEIKRDDESRRDNFRSRHDCENKTDRTKAGYWSCKFWSSKSVRELLS